MRNFKLFFGLLAITVLALGIWSCSKDTTSEPADVLLEKRTTENNQNDCNELVSNARVSFGKLIFKAMQEDALFSTYIKQKMLLEFNSNYSFLYIKERNSIVHSGKTFDQLLVDNSGLATSVAQQTLADILCNDPLITISMSDRDNVNATDWVNTIPSIAAVKACDNTKYILYSNSAPNGVEMTIDPTVPTINIIESEIYYLVKANGMTSVNKKIDDYMPAGPSITSIVNCTNFLSAISNTSIDYFVICGNSFKLFHHNDILQMYIDCFNLTSSSIPPDNGTGPVGPGPNPCDKPCARDCETLDETLVRYRIKNWQVYKAIANRFWETEFIFHGNVLAARNYSNSSAIPHTARYVSQAFNQGNLLNCTGLCTGKWLEPNYRIWIDWDRSDFGDPYYIDWSEEDNGIQTFGISFPFVAKFKIGPLEASAGVTFSIAQTSGSTVALGNQPVFYCDPILKLNYTGSLVFACN